MYLNFNSASATIILSLNSLNSQLKQTETELSTGNAVNSPADNPVIWAEASRAQSGAAGWGAVANEMEGVDSPELTTATSALSTVLSTLDDMQTTLEGVTPGDTDDTATALAKLQTYGKALASTVADAASSNSVNLLDGSTTSVSFVEGYNQIGSVVQTVAFTCQALTGKAGMLTDAKASGTAMDLTALSDDDLVSATTINNTLANIDGAISSVRSYSAYIGGMSSSETNMQDFAQTMQTTLQDGADDLIGVDFNTLSARESALQTQMQLATQALSISTQSSQLVLKLFG